MAVVQEPDLSDADSHSEADVTDTPVEQLIDTSSLSSSSQVSLSWSFTDWHCCCDVIENFCPYAMPTLSPQLLKFHLLPHPTETVPIPTSSRYTCKKSQSLSQVCFKYPLRIQTHNTDTHANTIRNTASIVIVIVQSISSLDKAVRSARHEAMCRRLNPSTDSQLS